MNEASAPNPAGGPADDGRNLIVMSFDAKMFDQARQCIATISKHLAHAAELAVVAIDLEPGQSEWLSKGGAKVFSDYRSLPGFEGAPAYAWAMSCRAYLREIFSGYDYYVYIDPDIRLLNGDGIRSYFNLPRLAPGAIAICQEIDPAYCFVNTGAIARKYHELKYERMRRAFGDAADEAKYLYSYNCGIFGMHKDCAVWGLYRKYLEQAMRGAFDHMVEQDAMLLAIMKSEMNVVPTPCTMNWLCSAALPLKDSGGRWVRSLFPHEPISVVHLSASNYLVESEKRRLYDVYREMKLTE
jgi:hypothetical protein